MAFYLKLMRDLGLYNLFYPTYCKTDFINIYNYNFYESWGKPGAALQTQLSLIHLVCLSGTLFLSWLYGAAKLKRLEMALQVVIFFF